VWKLIFINYQKRYDTLMEWSWDVDNMTMDKIINKTIDKISVKDLGKRLFNFYYITRTIPGVGQLTKKWAYKKAEENYADPHRLMRIIEEKYNYPFLGVKWETLDPKMTLKDAIDKKNYDLIRILAYRSAMNEFENISQIVNKIKDKKEKKMIARMLISTRSDYFKWNMFSI